MSDEVRIHVCGVHDSVAARYSLDSGTEPTVCRLKWERGALDLSLLACGLWREVRLRRIDWLCQWHYTTGTSDDECPEPGECRYVYLPKGTLLEETGESPV